MSAYTHLWFCRECKTKGNMLGNGIADLFVAERQHPVISPTCSGMIRIATIHEVQEEGKEVLAYVDWDV